MELSQRSISRRAEIGFILCLLLAALILSLLYISDWTLTILILGLIYLSLFRFLPENTIIVSECGIACLGKTDTLWSFDWDEIQALVPSRRERVSNLELKVTSHRYMDILAYRQYENELYFQLDRKARKALAQYAPARLMEELK